MLNGPINAGVIPSSSNLMCSHVLSSTVESFESVDFDRELVSKVRKFWDIQDIGVSKEAEINLLDQAIEFDGRNYSVRLTWKCDQSILPDNFLLGKTV